MSEKKGTRYEEMELRRGPWTLEEDTLLIHYIACHGEGRWNLLARCSGLKRTGKSCRLRWLNYLKPDVKRGNLSPEEQFLILELHSKWGNRWSRIAQYLPGRTDNEIKNYWRTRVQKQARQLKIDANSTMFRDAVRCYWMPRLLEKMESSPSSDPNPTAVAVNRRPPPDCFLFDQTTQPPPLDSSGNCSPSASSDCTALAQLPADFPDFPPAGGLDAAPFDPFGQAAFDLAPVSASLLDCTTPGINCVDDNPGDFWTIDELWLARKQLEWGGI